MLCSMNAMAVWLGMVGRVAEYRTQKGFVFSWLVDIPTNNPHYTSLRLFYIPHLARYCAN